MVPKKTEFLDKSSINIDILPVYFGRREASSCNCFGVLIPLDHFSYDTHT